MEVMDMTLAVQGLVNLFLNMDGTSRVMFIRLLVTKMEDDEIDLLLQVVELRHKNENIDSPDVLKFLDLKGDDVKEEPDEYDNNSNFDSPNYDAGENNDLDMEEKKMEFDGKGSLKIETNPDKKEQSDGKKLRKGEKEFKCNQCPYSSAHQSNLTKHIRTHTGERPYSCLFCKKAFINKNHMYRHGKKHIGESNLLCEKCPKESLTEDQLTMHNEQHVEDLRTHTDNSLNKIKTDGIPYQCQYCEQSFIIYSELQKHRRTHPEHKERIKRKWNRKDGTSRPRSFQTIICDECGKTLRSKGDLKRHINLHAGIKPWACEECPHTSSTKGDLKKHKLIHTEDRPKPFMCDICSKSFGGSTDLKRHRTVHTGEKGFSCDQCSYETARLGSLEKHLRIHTGERPFVCHICSSKFVNKSHLNRHLKGHSGEKTQFCDQCPQAFITPDKLKAHKVLHSGEKNFFCDLCPNSFTTNGSLVRHKNIHLGVKAYSCEECGRAFVDKSNLVKHQVVHNENRVYPFVCDICLKSFDRPDNLERHRRTHTGEKPFSCAICGGQFAENGTLKNHLNRVHPNHMIENIGPTSSQKMYTMESMDSKKIQEQLVEIQGDHALFVPNVSLHD